MPSVLGVCADVPATLGIWDTIWTGGSADFETYFARIFAFLPPTRPLNVSRICNDSYYHDYYSHFSIIFTTFPRSDAMVSRNEQLVLIRITNLSGLFTIEISYCRNL